MQALDGGHQLALFGRLDAVGHADQAGARTDGLEQRQAQFHPAGGELVQIECLAVKQMQQAVVSLGAQAENPDIAANPSQIQSATEANQGSGASTGKCEISGKRAAGTEQRSSREPKESCRQPRLYLIAVSCYQTQSRYNFPR